MAFTDPAGGAPSVAWLALVIKRVCRRARNARRREVRELLPSAEGEPATFADAPAETEGRVVDFEQARSLLRGLKTTSGPRSPDAERRLGDATDGRALAAQLASGARVVALRQRINPLFSIFGSLQSYRRP
jgi:hypothetical protein